MTDTVPPDFAAKEKCAAEPDQEAPKKSESEPEAHIWLKGELWETQEELMTSYDALKVTLKKLSEYRQQKYDDLEHNLDALFDDLKEYLDASDYHKACNENYQIALSEAENERMMMHQGLHNEQLGVLTHLSAVMTDLNKHKKLSKKNYELSKRLKEVFSAYVVLDHAVYRLDVSNSNVNNFQKKFAACKERTKQKLLKCYEECEKAFVSCQMSLDGLKFFISDLNPDLQASWEIVFTTKKENLVECVFAGKKCPHQSCPDSVKCSECQNEKQSKGQELLEIFERHEGFVSQFNKANESLAECIKKTDALEKKMNAKASELGAELNSAIQGRDFLLKKWLDVKTGKMDGLPVLWSEEALQEFEEMRNKKKLDFLQEQEDDCLKLLKAMKSGSPPDKGGAAAETEKEDSEGDDKVTFTIAPPDDDDYVLATSTRPGYVITGINTELR